MEKLVELPYAKREKIRQDERDRDTEEMRTSLPVYSLEQIREFKMPYHEARLISLYEKGYDASVSFLKDLFEYQEDIRAQAGPGTYIWTRPQLIYSKKDLDFLISSLKKSEDFHKKSNFQMQCEEFLSLAVHFAFLHQDWWWLGEQLLIQSINASMDYPTLHGKYEALSRYVYAKFEVENVREYRSAENQLEIARKLCAGRGWNTKLFFKDAKATLFVEVNKLLYECFIREAKYYATFDVDKAISLAMQAKRRAAEACFTEGETEALLLKGVSEMQSNQIRSAITTFTKAFYIQKKLDNIPGMCKVRIELAKAYLLDGNTTMSLKTLLSLKEAAETHELPYYLAKAYKNLGEYYLCNGAACKANSFLKEAFKLFSESDDRHEDIGIVRNLEAISAGLELFPSFLLVLYQSEERDKKSEMLLKIIDWKDQRSPFWSVDMMTDTNFNNMMHDSVKEIAEMASRVSYMMMEKEQRSSSRKKSSRFSQVVTFQQKKQVEGSAVATQMRMDTANAKQRTMVRLKELYNNLMQQQSEENDNEPTADKK